MQDPTEFLFVAMLLCSSMSCTLSMFSMFSEQGGSKGGFGGGFWRGLTNPVGATGDLIGLAQGKQPGNTMQQASSEQECILKCGGPQGCERGRAGQAAGMIPAERADMWSWCSGVPSSTVSTTSKEKFGQACCPL
jgi:hypothetical protein